MKQRKIIYIKPEMNVYELVEDVIVTSGDIYDADEIEGTEGGIKDVWGF